MHSSFKKQLGTASSHYISSVFRDVAYLMSLWMLHF